VGQQRHPAAAKKGAKNMRKTLIILMIVLCFGVLGVYFYMKHNPALNISKFEGFWYREEFIKKLHESKSAIKASQNFDYISITFLKYKDSWESVKYKNSYEVAICGPFEGDGGIIQKTALLLRNKVELLFFDTAIMRLDGQKINFTTDNLENPQKITLEYKGKRINFVKLKGTYEDYINLVTLVGKYKDDEGNIYIFNENNTAVWLNKNLKYDIGFDPIWSSDDFISVIEKDNKSIDFIYCYEWKDNKLYVYNGESKNQGEIFRKDLYVVLSKM